MIVNWQEILSQLGSSAIFSAIASFLIGGFATFFKDWIVSEDQFKDRIDFAKQRIFVKLAKSHTQMLNIFLNSNVSLEESPPAFVIDHAENMIKLNDLSQKINKLNRKVSSSFGFLLFTIITSLIGILLAFAITEIRPYIALFFYMLIILQGVMIMRIRKARKILENYSQTI